MKNAVWMVAVLAAAGCELLTEDAYSREPVRREDKSNGDVFADTEAGAHALVFGRAPQQVDASGALAITQLPPGVHALSLALDDDGDGIVDQRAEVSVELLVGELANPGGNPFGGVTEDVVGSVLLGAVELEATATITGTVSAGAGTARVVAFRVVDGVARGVEAEAAADDTGAFELAGVGPGEVRVAAFTGGAVEVSEAVTVEVAAGETVALDAALVTDADPGDAGLFLAANPIFPLDERVTLYFWDRLSDKRPECRADDDNLEVDLTGDRVVVPAGLYDLAVCTAGDVFLLPGVALPAGGDDLVMNGLVTLKSFIDASNADDASDLDRDGRPGLPIFLPGETPPAEWDACANACGDAHGAAAVGASCTVGERDFDCDDDGDGQADVTEPIECYGPGLGGDRDGDGLCDPSDPFPYCSANDAADCPAGDREVP
jgi:hypothetical protein